MENRKEKEEKKVKKNNKERIEIEYIGVYNGKRGRYINRCLPCLPHYT